MPARTAVTVLAGERRRPGFETWRRFVAVRPRVSVVVHMGRVIHSPTQPGRDWVMMAP